MLKHYTKDMYLLLFWQLLAHVALVMQLIYGSWQDWVASGLVYFATGCFGMTMTYHRLLSHRSWEAPRWFEIAGTLLGTYGLTGSSIAWVAIHREHHHYTDKEKDPHSPTNKGFIRVQWLSMFDKPHIRYALNLMKDPFHLWIHNHYFHIHATIMLALLLINPWYVVTLYLTPAALLWNAGSFINTLTHMVGYRNHETKDNSTNILWLGYLVWGEGWHNNHHHKPSNHKFGEKWWEIDVGNMFIELLKVRR